MSFPKLEKVKDPEIKAVTWSVEEPYGSLKLQSTGLNLG